ncbi:hypothetical protein GCM10017750_33990 [Streptomyces racemochromogenes]|nr:hypothetical protein D1J60_16725 [Streptomyces sp. W1SF4]
MPDWAVRAEYISDLLMFALGVVLALATAAVAVRERQARGRLEDTLAQVAQLSAARERNRLAREIHDSLGHHLTAIGFQLEKAEAFASLDPAASAQAVSHARWSAGGLLRWHGGSSGWCRSFRRPGPWCRRGSRRRDGRTSRLLSCAPLCGTR